MSTYRIFFILAAGERPATTGITDPERKPAMAVSGKELLFLSLLKKPRKQR